MILLAEIMIRSNTSCADSHDLSMGWWYPWLKLWSAADQVLAVLTATKALSIRWWYHWSWLIMKLLGNKLTELITITTMWYIRIFAQLRNSSKLQVCCVRIALHLPNLQLKLEVAHTIGMKRCIRLGAKAGMKQIW